MKISRRQLPVALVGLVWLAAALSIWIGNTFNLRERPREAVFDVVLPRLAPRTADPRIVVVDIDRDSLARHGAWPWSRLLIASLLERIMQAKPAVLGLDILLSEPDRLSPAALARNLGAATGREDIAALASVLPDGDAKVAAALKTAPAVLGFVLDAFVHRTPPPAVPILARGAIKAPDIWQVAGAIGPPEVIEAAAQGFGTIVLAADADGSIRRVPLLVLINGEIRPGLAVELVRVASEASSLILDTPPPRLHIGPVVVPIDPDVSLRLLPRRPASWRARTIPAWQVLDDDATRARLAGRIVLVGSGAPELGGLRVTPVSATTPSVQIQADAVEMLRAQDVPSRPPWIAPAEVVALVVLGMVAIALAIFRRPVQASVLTGLICLIWVATAVGAFLSQRLMIDMAGPPALTLLVFAATAIGGYADNERRERVLRRRFEQHLSPDVVKQIVDNPRVLRLEGESREVTAMFTDIEGFTSLTERSEAADVVMLLDGYLEILTDIVISHGGMVDKLIGDGMFVLFNVPVDLADHPRKALACAREIVAAAETYRETPIAQKLGLGRTRVGIETGVAIVGDVGGGRKLDYTALGTVVNTAARLEAANKEFGSTIAVGPGAAAWIESHELERLGALQLRGRSVAVDVFTVAKPTIA
jgi:adenylate cyclase